MVGVDMIYKIVHTPKADADIEKLKKSGDIPALKKLSVILKELIEHPLTGSGKPEPLTGDLAGCYSRRISQKHRLVYKICDTEVVVLILSALGHYDDK
ncbi:toxin YoeB [Bacteroidia bacterium]|nr:toxin YoeB [Bacteroidia bacterium]